MDFPVTAETRMLPKFLRIAVTTAQVECGVLFVMYVGVLCCVCSVKQETDMPKVFDEGPRTGAKN
jgi:hypothetical protein